MVGTVPSEVPAMLHFRTSSLALICIALFSSFACSQECGSGQSLMITVKDPDGAIIEDARMFLTDQDRTTTLPIAKKGMQYGVACVSPGKYTVTSKAVGFQENTQTVQVGSSHSGMALTITLKLAVVESERAVNGDSDDPLSRSAGSAVLNQSQISGLAEDRTILPDKLQALAAAGGSIPGKAIITVDGFQSSSTLPPKGLIKEVRINPDMFSAEYATPPYAGGRIEAYTKPGQTTVHGTLFGYSSSAFLSISAAMSFFAIQEASCTGPTVRYHMRASQCHTMRSG
jgi:hypothetical protein